MKSVVERLRSAFGIHAKPLLTAEIVCHEMAACEFLFSAMTIGGMNLAEAQAARKKASHLCTQDDDCWANIVARERRRAA